MVVALGGYGWYLELSGCCIVTVGAQIKNNSCLSPSFTLNISGTNSY